MSKKTKIVLCIVVIVSLIGLGAAFFFYNQKEEPKLETDPMVSEETTNTEVKKGQLLTGQLTDESGLMTEEEKKETKQGIQNTLDEHYKTMFDFDENTPDFTGTIQNQWVKPDEKTKSLQAHVKNIYPEFTGVHLKSQFQDSYLAWVLIRKDTKNPELIYNGVINVHMSCDKLEEGDYSIITYGSMIFEDGKWRLAKEDIGSVVEQGKYEHTLVDDYENTVQVRTSKVLMKWDFYDLEGFLTDYKYNMDIDWDKYSEEGVYVLD